MIPGIYSSCIYPGNKPSRFLKKIYAYTRTLNTHLPTKPHTYAYNSQKGYTV